MSSFTDRPQSESSRPIIFLFEVVDAELVPRLPHNPNGTRRVPDGKSLLSLEQGAKLSGLSQDRLRTRWLAQWADYIRPTDEVETDGEPVDTATDSTPVAPRADDLTRLDSARLLAHRSGLMDGTDAPQWCGEDGEWRDSWAKADERPVAARVKVWRKGILNGFVGVAHLAEFSAGSLCDTMPVHTISEYAELLALSKAFPEAFGPADTQALSQVDTDGQDVSEDMTPRQYDLALVNLGFGTPAKRAAVKQILRTRMPQLATENEPAFFDAAIQEIRRNPTAYGATLPPEDDAPDDVMPSAPVPVRAA